MKKELAGNLKFYVAVLKVVKTLKSTEHKVMFNTSELRNLSAETMNSIAKDILVLL